MTVTKTQLSEAYAAALTKGLGDEWGFEFSRRDASKLLEILWPVVSELAMADTTKAKAGSVPLGNLGRFKLSYKPATKARKGTNPFTGEPTTFKAKPASIQARFTAGKAFKEDAAKYAKRKLK